MRAFIEFEPHGAFTPAAVAAACVEQGEQAILIDRDALPPAFFDLSTGVAGELAQRLTLYGVRLACVVPDLSAHSERFQEFAREANQGRQFRFFDSREDATAWLESE